MTRSISLDHEDDSTGYGSAKSLAEQYEDVPLGSQSSQDPPDYRPFPLRWPFLASTAVFKFERA